MAELCPLEGRVVKWQLAFFGINGGHFWPLFLDINFQFVWPNIYINIDGQTDFKVNQT